LENEHQKAFDTIKKLLSSEILHSYPDFSTSFDIHTDENYYQPGAVISQNQRPIAFCLRKLSHVS
jgi:RNase H-like domain found in reverse transcriptase